MGHVSSSDQRGARAAIDTERLTIDERVSWCREGRLRALEVRLQFRAARLRATEGLARAAGAVVTSGSGVTMAGNS